MGIYDYKVKTRGAGELDLATLKGKVLLIVNTATGCGFTPQYAGLEALNKKYAERGLVVIGFPCDQFLHQEPGSDEEIAEFCQLNFGVTFMLTKKTDVNGEGAHPVFKYLKKAAGGWLGDGIKWNFTKFLVSRDSGTIKRYAPTVKPESIEEDIVRMLDKE